MTAQPIPPQPYRTHPHPHAQPAIPLNVTAPNAPITLTVMPAALNRRMSGQAGIQRLGSCGVRP